MKRIKTLTTILTLIINLGTTTPQPLSKHYYLPSTERSRPMLLLPVLPVSQFQDRGLGIGDVVISTLSLLLQIRDALRMKMASLKGQPRVAEVSHCLSVSALEGQSTQKSHREKYHSSALRIC